jgi:lysozyme
MNTSPAGLDLIKQSEALRLVPYNDAVGNATVGYGHLLHRGPLNGTEVSITPAEALSLLAQDVFYKAEIFVNKITCPLNQNQYDALVDFCFNLGPGNLETVATETGLYTGSPQYAEVGPKILLYNKARNQSGVLVPLPGLTSRREKEAELFDTPLPTPPAAS